MDPDRSLDKCAARQYGVFSRKQAVRAGLTSKMIHTRLASGAWIRLAPSVFAMASAPPKWERQMAAALLSRDGSIAAGASAAFLHEFEGFTAGRPVIMVQRGRQCAIASGGCDSEPSIRIDRTSTSAWFSRDR